MNRRQSILFVFAQLAACSASIHLRDPMSMLLTGFFFIWGVRELVRASRRDEPSKVERNSISLT